MGIGPSQFTTFKTIRDSLSDFVPELGDTTIAKRVAKNYQALLKDWQWSFLKGYKNVYCIPVSSTGLVTVTQGSPAIVGTNTNWTTDMAGRSLRVDIRESYLISGVTDTTHLTLTENFGGDSATNVGYTMYQNMYSLGDDVREISKLKWDVALIEKSREFLDRNDPYRSQIGTPLYWCDMGIDADGFRQIEIFPIPASNYVIKCNYWKGIPDLSDDDDVILIREDLLQEACLIDLYRIASNVNSIYKNEVANAVTIFQKLWLDAIEEDMRKCSHEDETRDYEDDGRYGTDWEVSHYYQGGTF